MKVNNQHQTRESQEPEIVTEAVEIYEMARSIPRDVAKIGWWVLVPVGSIVGLVWLVWSSLT